MTDANTRALLSMPTLPSPPAATLSRAAAVLLLLIFAGSRGHAQTEQLLPCVALPSLSTSTSAVAVADLDGDGVLDIVTTASAPPFPTPGIVVLMGKADGTFEPPVIVQGSRPTILFVGDATMDGIPDVIAPGSKGFPSGSVWVHPGIGDGTFEPAIETPLGQFYPYDAAVGDLDEDGVTDVVMKDLLSSDTLMLLGKPDGSFQNPINLAEFGGFGEVLIDDFDVDGHLDVAFTNSVIGKEIAVLLGHGDGSFEPAQFSSSSGSLFAFRLSSGDLDNDGRPDLVVSGGTPAQGDTHIAILRNDGEGTFTEMPPLVAIGSVNDTSLKDVDGDHFLDIVTGGSMTLSTKGPGVVGIHFGQGGFQFERLVVKHVSAEVLTVESGDFDRDGRPDFVFGQRFEAPSQPEQHLVVLFNAAFGDISALEKIPVSYQPLGVGLADMNGDGHLDCVVIGPGTTEVQIALGAGNGSFAATVGVAVGFGSRKLAIADLDDDGVQDLVVNTFFLSGPSVSALLGSGDGVTFGPPITVFSGDVDALEVSDLDGDGLRDVVATRASDGSVLVALNAGGGTFHPATAILTGGAPIGLAIEDFNGDQIPDLAVADSTQEQVLLFEGNGDGTFLPPLSHPAAGTPQWLAAADFDLDGDIDLAVTSLDTLDVTVLLNTGAGTFVTASPLPLGINSQQLLAADIDGDGRPDLLNRHQTEDVLSLALGHGDGSFDPPVLFVGGDEPTGLDVADVDGDGFLDVASASLKDATVWILRNRSETWWDIGFALEGSLGLPQLAGSGAPAPDEQVTLTATDLAADAIGLLVVGLQKQLAPLHGGLLVPSVDITLLVFPGQPLVSRWPKGLDVGTSVYLQAWFVTPSLGGEVSATNALAVIAQ